MYTCIPYSSLAMTVSNKALINGTICVLQDITLFLFDRWVLHMERNIRPCIRLNHWRNLDHVNFAQKYVNGWMGGVVAMRGRQRNREGKHDRVLKSPAVYIHVSSSAINHSWLWFYDSDISTLILLPWCHLFILLQFATVTTQGYNPQIILFASRSFD